jgi:hypothetical protein
VKEVKGNGSKPSLAGNSTFLFIVALLLFWIKGLIRPERQNKTKIKIVCDKKSCNSVEMSKIRAIKIGSKVDENLT